MNVIMLVLVLIVVVAVLGAAYLIYHRRFRPIKVERFQTRWVQLQKLCADKAQWPAAILDADKLLDEALKNKHVGGKTMGERMVRAQRVFTDNDGVWFGHKLRNKIDSDPEVKLKETDVKDALIGIRQALKDLGALPASKKAEDHDK